MLYDNCLLNSKCNLIFQNRLPRYNFLNILCIIKNEIWLTSHFICRYETLLLAEEQRLQLSKYIHISYELYFFLSFRFEFDILFSLCILFGQCTFYHILG